MHPGLTGAPELTPGCPPSPAPTAAPAGQTQPTRVVRLLAEETVERQVLEAQRRKLEAGEVPTAGANGAGAAAAGGASGSGAGGGEAEAPALAEVDAGMLLRVYEAIK